MTDIFSWHMSAAMHRESVAMLRSEILESHSDQSPFPIALILELLPLNTPNGDQVSQRGNFEWQGDSFSNNYSSETWVEFSDPVLGTFSATLPALWSGTAVFDGDKITVNFDEAIEVTIPEIANQGVNRSITQRFERVVLTPAFSRSRFVDSTDQDKISLIIAALDPQMALSSSGAGEIEEEAEIADSAKDLEYFRALTTSGSCGGGDPEDPNWYVYQRRDGLCFVHYGTIINQAHIYTYRYGPDVKSACDAFARDHCDPIP